VTHRPDDGGSTDVRNVGTLMPVYTALQPRRQPFSRNLINWITSAPEQWFCSLQLVAWT
jgi:hypothetical protein